MTPITRKVADWIEKQDSFTIVDIEREFGLLKNEASQVLAGTKRHGYIYIRTGSRNRFTYKLKEIKAKKKEINYTWLSSEYKEKLGSYKELSRLTGLCVSNCRRVWIHQRRIHKKYLELIDGGVGVEEKRSDLLKLALGI